MSTITNHITEMQLALINVTEQVDALTDLISIGNFSDAELRELEEDLSHARIRMIRLQGAIVSDENLLQDGYPTPLIFDTTDAIKQNFLDRINRMEELVNGFKQEVVIGADGGTLNFEIL